MSKTAVSTIISNVKLTVDYNITDTNLDNLIVIGINGILRRMKQWFLDYEFMDEITAQDTFTTTASQAYVDIATETIDLDQPIVLSERTNDKVIQIISYDDFVELYPDPTISSSSTPDHAAFFANRLYLGPTPNTTTTLYLDYVKLLNKVTSASTLPFEDKYDELVEAGAREYVIKFLDRSNAVEIASIKQDIKELKDDLIVNAVNISKGIKQVESRRGVLPFIAPRMAK